MLSRRLLLILQCLVFFIPVNIYIINAWIGTGIQWIAVRYQVTDMGYSLIPVTKDPLYIITGTIQGRSAYSFFAGFLAFCLMVLALILLIVIQTRYSDRNVRIAGACTILGAVLCGCSDILQYGWYLTGPAGFLIPVGLPVIVVIGILIYKGNFRNGISSLNPCNPGSPATGKPGWSSIAQILNNSDWINLITLFFLALVVLELVWLPTLSIYINTQHYDTNLYYTYGLTALSGKVPYLDYWIEYPQFFFIPVAIALVPTLVVQNYWVFYSSFVSLMMVCEIGTVACLYFIAKKLLDQNRAYLCGILYVTGFAAAYYTFTDYDIFPAFLTILSCSFFIYRNETRAYLSAAIGALSKWYPAVLVPFFTLCQIKNNHNPRDISRNLMVTAALVALVTIPFMVLNPSNFFAPYTSQATRFAEAHSFVYYVDAFNRTIFHQAFFEKVSVIAMIGAEILLLLWYYRYGAKDLFTLFTVVFLSIFVFVLFNNALSPQYIVWITPFLAVLLSDSLREIILYFCVQLIFFIEHPVLFTVVYRPLSTYTILENSLPTLPFLFYTIKFGILMTTLYIILNNLRMRQKNNVPFDEGNKNL